MKRFIAITKDYWNFSSRLCKFLRDEIAFNTGSTKSDDTTRLGYFIFIVALRFTSVKYTASRYALQVGSSSVNCTPVPPLHRA